MLPLDHVRDNPASQLGAWPTTLLLSDWSSIPPAWPKSRPERVTTMKLVVWPRVREVGFGETETEGAWVIPGLRGPSPSAGGGDDEKQVVAGAGSLDLYFGLVLAFTIGLGLG